MSRDDGEHPEGEWFYVEDPETGHGDWLMKSCGIVIDLETADRTIDMIAADVDDPEARLGAIELFLAQDYADNPIAKTVQTMLRPLLDIDYTKNDNRRGAVAQALGLSKASRTLAKKQRAIWMDYNFTSRTLNETPEDFNKRMAKMHNLSKESVAKYRATTGATLKRGRPKKR